MRHALIIALAVQAITVAFGLIVWPGIWEDRDINGKAYRINRLTGELKVFDPVVGFIKPTPTPTPKLLGRPDTGMERIQFAGKMCDLQQKMGSTGFNRKQCIFDWVMELEKQHQEDVKEVEAGRATYDYSPMPSPTP